MYVRQASRILPISRKDCCLHSGYCASGHGACGVVKWKSATSMEAPAKNMRCVRVYELPRRNTSHEKSCAKRTTKDVQALPRAVSRSERVWVKGVWDASCAPCMGERLMKHVRDTSTFLNVICAYENKMYDRNIFSPDLSRNVLSIGVVPLAQLQMGK